MCYNHVELRISVNLCHAHSEMCAKMITFRYSSDTARNREACIAIFTESIQYTERNRTHRAEKRPHTRALHDIHEILELIFIQAYSLPDWLGEPARFCHISFTHKRKHTNAHAYTANITEP